MEPLSVHEAFAGRKILLAGASGFLGKVWLVMILDRVPEIDRIYLLLRRKGPRSARERFESIVNTSHAFTPLHERYGKRLTEFLTQRVEVLEGDLALPGFGLETEKSEELQRELDLIVNCAGLVEFNPDVREGVAANVESVANAVEFARGCERGSLVHVSTTFVAGDKEGIISESVDPHRAPNGDPFDPEEELRDLQRGCQRIQKEHERSATDEALRAKLAERMKRNGSNGKARMQSMLQLLRRRELREKMIQEGIRRAKSWGWPNTYCYTKGLAEALLAVRAQELRYVIFRPAIVESAIAYPLAGWNEGFNTSGPLAYLLGTWFRYLPARQGNPFDVVPVDLCCNALSIASAALLKNRHRPVYHCGTSDRNLFTIDRACELTALGHRIHYRKHGTNLIERAVLSRWETVPATPGHIFSVGNLRFLTKGIKKCIPSSVAPLKKVSTMVDRVDRKLEQIHTLLDLFKPFIHDTYHVFTCRAVDTHPVREKEFLFQPESFNWRTYWLNIHMPGLRRWCFPAIEGKERETYRPAYPFRLPPLPKEVAVMSEAAKPRSAQEMN